MISDAGEGLAHGAAGLGRLGGLLEAGGVQPLDLAADGELDRRDRESAAFLVAEAHVGADLQACGVPPALPIPPENAMA